MCYNVLCDKYATRQLYGYCPSWALNWEYRKKGIIEETRHYSADIISLQVRCRVRFLLFFGINTCRLMQIFDLSNLVFINGLICYFTSIFIICCRIKLLYFYIDSKVNLFQEVETDQFYNFFLPELKRDGYDGIFSPKSRARTMTESERKHVDGCAIFFRTAKQVPRL